MNEGKKNLSLKELQRYELEILIFFREICTKYNLKYFITAGTLLGAVRHKGFIPWDDDIDVVMPRKDYSKFAKIMRKNLYRDFFYQDSKTDKMYPFGFAKLRSNSCYVYEHVLRNVPIYNGCYIDIFPLDRCPNGDKKAGLFFRLHLFFTVVLLKKVNSDYDVGYTKRNAIFVLKVLSKFPLGMIKLIRENLRRCVFGKRICTVGGAHGYPKETYDRNWFEKSIELEFEGYKFSAPVGFKDLLERMYGNYMEPPSECEREGHFEKIKTEDDYETGYNLWDV